MAQWKWLTITLCCYSFFLNLADPTRDHIWRSTGISNPAWHLAQMALRVDQTTGSVHPQPTLPNCQLCINTEPTTSIGRLIKSSRLFRVSSSTQATLKQSPIQVLTELNVAWLQWSYEIVIAAAYQLGNTSSCTITEVKQRWVRLVLGFETVQVCCLSVAANP